MRARVRVRRDDGRRRPLGDAHGRELAGRYDTSVLQATAVAAEADRSARGYVISSFGTVFP